MSTQRTWRSALAIGTWLSVGLAAGVWAGGPQPLTRTQSTARYASARSMHSAAPDGVRAFALTLGRLGHEISMHRSAGRPGGDALVLLGPSVALAEEERGALLEWLRRGGHLLYAPAKSAAPEENDDCLKDALCVELLAEGDHVQKGSDAFRLSIGLGRAVILDDGGASLSNAALERSGIGSHGAWLGWWLDGVHHIDFDEARIGVATADGLLNLLEQSRYLPAALLGALGLLVALLASATRRSPVQADASAGSRDFGEHLDAVGELFRRDGRSRLARELLLAGTRHRLGRRARHAEVEAALSTSLELVPFAAALCRLETSLSPSPRTRDRPGPA
jgi:hypothetical protein